MFKTPNFWYEDKKAPLLLRVVSVVYNFFSKIYRSIQSTKKVPIPVICIGNITVGGSGKTPVAIAVVDILKELNCSPHFLSRGYGGNSEKPIYVEANQHDYSLTGDEPLLLAKHAPCLIAKNRAEGAAIISNNKADSIIMDDGFQNFSLFKDVSMLVIDGVRGFGNHSILPAGPLREMPKDGLARANACVVLNTTEETKKIWDNYLEEQSFNRPIFYANIVVAEELQEQDVIGFAGLGLPEKFKETLQSCGANIISFHRFADHHPYTEKEIMMLAEEAKEKNATLITTEKDFIRIPEKMQDSVKICRITLQWQDKQAIKSFLEEKLNKYKNEQ